MLKKINKLKGKFQDFNTQKKFSFENLTEKAK